LRDSVVHVKEIGSGYYFILVCGCGYLDSIIYNNHVHDVHI
jgi:hypothetical protein